MAIPLKSFHLPASIDVFLNEFWYDKTWYDKFLTEKLLDLSVQVDDWNFEAKSNSFPKQRTVRSFHPAKVSFPGLPSHAESLKTQEIHMVESGHQIIIKESTSFRGIPYAEYFSVNTEWTVTEQPMSPSSSSPSVLQTEDNTQVSVNIVLDIVFHHYTWLQGTIKSNTSAELMDVYELWFQMAETTLQKRQLTLVTAPKESVVITVQESIELSSGRTGTQLKHESWQDVDLEQGGASGRVEPRSEAAEVISEDDMLFYDCEEGDEESMALLHQNSQRQLQQNGGFGFFKTNSAEELHGIYSSHEWVSSHHLNPTHSLAVNIVETMFVFAEFSFWQVHRIYTNDMKNMFDASPSDIIVRIMNSFVPGYHSSILKQPDMYGPFIAVFSLPQVLLLSLEVHRSGCSQSSLLGNAVIVCLCLWIGLSALYRVLAFFIAPTLSLKHCLSITGYSFFAWNLSLLFSYPIEAFQDRVSVPVALPLIIFGLPSAIAQGCMFWEYTPAASTSTLQASIVNSPGRCQKLTNLRYRVLQQIVWAVPKVLAFAVVAGTHYQFLWYVARVFLPGRRQLCRLSAIVQPNQYADILTQKELRKYALILLSGKFDE